MDTLATRQFIRETNHPLIIRWWRLLVSVIPCQLPVPVFCTCPVRHYHNRRINRGHHSTLTHICVIIMECLAGPYNGKTTLNSEGIHIIIKKNVSCEVDDFVETHLCKLRGILRSRVLRVMSDLVNNVSPHWGGQNLTAVELGACINMWLWIYVTFLYISWT